MGDTDMWYHLNGGRYFWEHMTIPNTSFFSFIDPPREWINYFWGFQALIFKVYEYLDYFGLLLLRAILSSATLIMVFFYIQSNKLLKNNIFIFLVFISFAIVLEGRFFQLRPHLFSFFFIVTFIYILDKKPSFSPLLPIIAIPWINIHGVEWPIPAVICGAFFLNLIHKKFFLRLPLARFELITFSSILLCSISIFINPHSWNVLVSPFRLPPDTNLYIQELQPVSIDYFSSIQVVSFQIPYTTALTFLGFFSLYSFFVLAYKRQLPLASGIMFLSGCYLLTRGNRFIWEWLLLSLPLIRNGLEQLDFEQEKRKYHHYALILILSSLTLNTIYQKSKSFSGYPFDSSTLPVGSADFLINIGGSGKVMVPPSYAGYIEWKLYPNYLAFIDMQFPPSNDFDFYQISKAYNDENAFNKFLRDQNPDWLLIPQNSPMKKIIGELDSFSPVFRDDLFAVFANNQSQKILSERYKLQYIDVFNHLKSPDKTSDKEKYINEYLDLIDLSPSSAPIYYAISYYYLTEKKYDESFKFALLYQEASNNSPNADFLLGKIFSGLENYDRALNSFETAISNSRKKTHKLLNSYIAITYYLKQDFDNAYKFFNKSINPYKDTVSNETLYMYALSSLVYGEIEKAERLLQIIEYSFTYETDQDILIQTKDLRQKIEAGKFDNPNFFKWLYDSAINLFN